MPKLTPDKDALALSIKAHEAAALGDARTYTECRAAAVRTRLGRLYSPDETKVLTGEGDERLQEIVANRMAKISGEHD